MSLLNKKISLTDKNLTLKFKKYLAIKEWNFSDKVLFQN